MRPAPAEGLGEGATTKNNPRPQGGRKEEGGVSHGLRQQQPVSQSQWMVQNSKSKKERAVHRGSSPAEWARSARPWKIPGSQDQEKEGRADTCHGAPGSDQRCSRHPTTPGLQEEKPRHWDIRHPA